MDNKPTPRDYEGAPFEEKVTELLEDVLGGWAVVVYNDDINTFDHVIHCLVQYCDHTEEQAEQCSILIHFKGKCAVKHGGSDQLEPIVMALCDKGLQAKLEEA
ncbi:MAG: ATP-dependent Clp protease adaptor ClpS [Flavobacteriales bacterium]|nr:ATP-dependent Clp protease adaptor ClpS [Bacteroidota bacterium]MCB9239523.1 ATP-dependent Clp protease adaptor ClpS [Flavobacteriales bacterium]